MLPHTSQPTPYCLIMVTIVFYFTQFITSALVRSHYNRPAEKEKTEGDGRSIDDNGNLGNTGNCFMI